jgi:hypothetical protein
MTMVMISDEDPRSIRAVQIAAGAAQWLKCHGRDGQKLYGIPSCTGSGRYYLVNTIGCDCRDAERHPGQACKHVLAVRLHVALVGGTRTRRQSATRHSAQPAHESHERFWRRFQD